MKVVSAKSFAAMVETRLGLANAAFIYLIAIVLLSLMGGLFASAILFITAVEGLNYFFAPPIFDFRVAYASDAVMVTAFLLTSLIVTGLVGRLRKQTDAALKAQGRGEQAEGETRLAINALSAMVCRTQPDGAAEFFNQAWLDYTGLSMDQALGWGWIRNVHPDDAASLADKWRAIRVSEVRGDIEMRLRHFDGEYRWFLFRAEPLRDEVGRIIKWYGTCIDIEDQKRTEIARQESEQRFRDYAETASDWLWETGPDHTFVRTSEQVGAVAELRLGMARWDFATDIEEEPEKWRLHIAALEARQLFRDFRYRTTRGDGSALYIATSGKPFFDQQGRFLGYRGGSSDVTAAVRAAQAEEALRTAQADLAHVTRVTMLGELTASIAHEVNQPLTAIVANGEACLRWLSRETPNLDEARRNVERIINDGTRAGDVIRRVRALANKTDTEKVPLDINSVVNEVISLVQRELFRHRVPLRMELSPGLPMVLADRVQLQQVIINLVINGIEAMQLVADRPRDLVIGSRQDDAHQVLVTVKDCGVGIPAENADRLFTAFFTSKSSGMGIGLSICRSIVEAHGGRLWASRNVGPGATFQFTLPAFRDLSHDSAAPGTCVRGCSRS